MADRLRCVVKRITYQNPDNGYSVIHKSQGSEYPIVILPVSDRTPPMLLSRNLLYTAVTRAQNLVILVGSEAALARMVANDRETMRYTGLTHWLLEKPS